MTTLGVGLYLQESVILQAEVEVGDNTSIHMAAVVGHESKIGHSVFVAHAVSISGCCEIGDGTFVGTKILQRISMKTVRKIAYIVMLLAGTYNLAKGIF